MNVVMNNEIKVDIEDLKELTNVLKGLDLLGKKVVAINTTDKLYFDIENACYKDYDKFGIAQLAKYIWSMECIQVEYKKGRLYIEFDGEKIILPKNLRNLYDDNLSLNIIID